MHMVDGLEWLRSTAAPVIEDRVFGNVRASGCDRNGWVWESLELFDTPRGMIDLCFIAGLNGPGPAHHQQLNAVLRALDALTLAAAPMILAKLAGLTGVRYSADPWSELEWRGADLTDREGEFRLNYSSRSWAESLIVVQFEQSRPVAVWLED